MKSLTLTKKQYNGLVFLHGFTGRMLEQASPEDETPLEVTFLEGLNLIGEELAGFYTDSEK